MQLDRENTKRLIKKNGRTRAWLADQMAITLKHFNKVICGEVSAGPRFVTLLSRLLEVDESELLIHDQEAS